MLATSLYVCVVAVTEWHGLLVYLEAQVELGAINGD